MHAEEGTKQCIAANAKRPALDSRWKIFTCENYFYHKNGVLTTILQIVMMTSDCGSSPCFRRSSVWGQRAHLRASWPLFPPPAHARRLLFVLHATASLLLLGCIGRALVGHCRAASVCGCVCLCLCTVALHVNMIIYLLLLIEQREGSWQLQ